MIAGVLYISAENPQVILKSDRRGSKVSENNCLATVLLA